MIEVRIPHYLVPPLSNAMPDPIQSITNFQLDNSSGSQRQKLSPKQLLFDPIPKPCTKLLPLLTQNELVILTPTDPPKPPYPRWYGENAHYEFHLGTQGHSTDDCEALKYQVQALMEGGYLNFVKKLKEEEY
ncbi:hypothetical protein CRYUN_Cryun07bG0063700 [Craigia yunnanensis]